LDKHTQVIDLALNAQTGAYKAVIDMPPPLIHVTPVVQPRDSSNYRSPIR
jgi:hypothetical protein